jgi:hypothetical protein
MRLGKGCCTLRRILLDKKLAFLSVQKATDGEVVLFPSIIPAPISMIALLKS